jgi:hypothetical protein
VTSTLAITGCKACFAEVVFSPNNTYADQPGWTEREAHRYGEGFRPHPASSSFAPRVSGSRSAATMATK